MTALTSDRMGEEVRLRPPIGRTVAICLALVAGYVDAVGLRVVKTYVSFMSGNTTQAGAQLGQGRLTSALPFVLAIVFFVGGSFAGTLLAHAAPVRSRQVLFAAVAALLCATIGVIPAQSATTEVAIAMLASAMGMMNTTVSQIGSEGVSLTFVTGNLSRLGRHLALAVCGAPSQGSESSDTHLGRALLLGSVWLAFLSGAVLSAAAISHLRTWTLLPPVLVLLTLGLLSGTSRTQR
jgi:uncharacterized membrane protein YoaK (UPF0700 family)